MSVDHSLPLKFWISASTFICVCVIPIIHCFWASLSFKSVLRWFPSWLFSKFQRHRSGWEGHHYPPATVSVHSTHSPRIQSCLHPLASLVSEFICAETHEPSASYFVSLLILTELPPFLPPLPPEELPQTLHFVNSQQKQSVLSKGCFPRQLANNGLSFSQLYRDANFLGYILKDVTKFQKLSKL